MSKYSDIVSDGGMDPRNKFDKTPEPVAWINKDILELKHIIKAPIQVCRREPDEYYDVPLYTHPQSKVEQEPFGIWHQGETEDESEFYLYSESGDVSCPNCIKLYTQPKQPLTDEQIHGCIKGMFKSGDPWLSFARAIEAAHGIKGGT